MKCSGLFSAIRAAVCVALFWSAVPAVWAQSNSTITSLNVLPGTTVSAGTILTFTATVTSGGGPVSAGLVKFCDMETAAYCEDSAVLGSIGVTKSGTATLKMPLAYGTHNVQAVFQGTKSYAGSSSAPQVVGVLTGALPSTTSVVYSAYLGNGGLNEAETTVSGAPIPALSGTLSYLDLSNSGYLLTSVPLSAPTNGFSALASVGGTPIPEPFYTVVGDFNGDGKLDFAVASDYVSTAQVFLGNGDGTFTLKSTISTSYPAGLIVGDFNGDGNLDLAVLNYSTISIYLGNGDGTFTLKSTPAAGDSPYSFAAADFNGDGILDFAVTNNYSNTVQILLGNGNGTFTTGGLYSTGSDPEDIVAADFNRDGKMDLALVNEMDSSVTVLLGNGNGTFTAGPSINLPANPYTLVVGDFNGDGIADLAVSDVVQGGEIYLGNGDGTFNLKSTVSTGSSGNGYGLATADFNHDGKTDLVVGGALFTGDGTGDFTLMSYVGGNGSPVSVGDFNGDGSPDLITPTYSTSYPFNGNVNISLEQSAVTVVTDPINVPGAGSHNVVASYSGDGAHAASQSSSVPLTGARVTTTLSLSITPGSSVSLGTPVQITASVSPNLVGAYSPTGTMTFNDGVTVLGTGVVSLGQAVFSTSALSVGTHTITASYGGDTNFAASSSAATVLTVASIAKTPVITWATPAAVSYGTPLSSAQLNASSGGVGGNFVYTPAAGTVLGVGVQTLSVTFTPTDTTNYTTATQTVTLTINKATPTISWATPAAITYGAALSATQLNASSTVAGTYVYAPAVGAALTAGAQTLSVTFTPTDTTDYATATQTVSLTVNKGVLTVTPNNASRTYGAANPTFTASYGGFVNGDTQAVLSGSPSLTTLATPSSATGTYTITAAAGTLSAANYSYTYVNGTLTVTAASLTVAANNQTKIYGQTLTLGTSAFTASGLANGDTISGVTLSSTGAAAGASVSGSPYAIVPSAATGSFTASNYSISYVNGTLTVTKASPTITWATPAAITYGTALSATQLNASSTVAGTYVYTPASGTVLAAGTQTLSVTLTPTDTTDYSTATQTVSLTVNKATQTITVTTAAPNSDPYNSQFTVAATASSGLAVTYSSSGNCSNVGPVFTITSYTGSCTITYSQAGDGNHTAASNVTGSTTAVPATQTITVTTPAPPSAAFNAQFTVAATATSGLAVNYGATGGCTNNGATFTMTSGSNACSITYSQAGNLDYNAAPNVTNTTTATLASQSALTVTGMPGTAQAYLATFSVGSSGGNGTGAVTFTASGVCSVSGTTVTMTSGTGTCSVTATKAADTNYSSVTSSAATVAATLANQAALTVTGMQGLSQYLATFTVGSSGGSGTGAVTFAGTGACSVSGNTVTMTSGTGTCSVTATKAADANYNSVASAAATTAATLANQATLTVTGMPGSSQPYGTIFTVGTSGGSGAGAVTFSASGSCSVAGATVTITNSSGNCMVTAAKAADTNYNSVTSQPAQVGTMPATQTITVNTAAPASAAYNSQFTVAATVNSPLAVSYGSSGGCTNSGATYTMTSGTTACTVTYSQTGNGYYSAATVVTNTTTAAKAAEATLTVTGVPGTAQAYNATFTVGSSGGSGTGAVTFAASGACSVAGTTVTMTSGAGTCSVTATKAADSNYSSATSVAATVAATLASQTITVTTAAPANKAFNGQFTVAATATSGLAVTYSASGGCTNSGATYTMTSGTTACSVKFDQAGSSNYNPATEVVESVTASQAAPSVTAWPKAAAITYGQTLASSTLSGGTASVAGSFAFTTPTTAPGAGTAAQSVTFTPTDTADYSSLSGTVNVTVSKATPVLTWATPSPITQGTALSATQLNATSGGVAGNFVYTPASGTVPAAGLQTLSVTFTPTDTTDYNSATTSVTLTVNQAPAITSVNNKSFTVGTAGSFTVTATGYPAATFSETGALPSGITLSTTGTLSGTPAAGTGGSYTITITAANGISPNATQTFTLTVNQVPAITSAANATFTVGTAGSFTVTANGYPASTFSETGTLPSGVTLSAAGVLSGTPAAATGGSYPITITAANGTTSNATQSFTLTVNQAPAITSANMTIFSPNTAGSFNVTATGYPAPTFIVTGTLPAGVTFTSAGVLSGTPTVSGGFPITITASNGTSPNSIQSFTLAVVGVNSSVVTAPSTTLSWSETVGTGANRVLLVGVSFRSDSTGNDSGSGTGNSANTYVTGVKYGTTSLTCLSAINDNATGSCGTAGSGTPIYMRSEVWYVMNPSSGTASVAVTTNNSTLIEASSATYTGVASVASGGTSASNNGQTGSNTASLGPVTSPAGNLVYANVATARSAAYPAFITSLNTPLSNLEDSAAGSFHIDGATSQSTATNPTMSWTWSALSSPWAVSSAVLTPTSGGSFALSKKFGVPAPN